MPRRTTSSRSPQAHRERRAHALVFAVALAAGALVTKSHIVSWNDASRFATVDALVRLHTFAIDGSPLARAMGDAYRYGGHLYSDKPPLQALEGAAVAEVLAPLGITLQRTPAAAIYLIVLLTVGVWFAVGCIFSFAFARRLGAPLRLASLVAALSGCGTLALPYATVMANHVPAGAALLASAYMLVDARRSTRAAILGGLLFALAYAFDVVVALCVPLAIVLLAGAPLRRWLAAAASAAPIVVAQLAFNRAVSAAAGPVALDPSSFGAASPFHRSAWVTIPFASLGGVMHNAWYELAGGKGLLAYTPLFLVCAAGLAILWRAGGERRRIGAAIALASIVYVVATIVLHDDTLSENYGQRRYVDVSFLLCVGLTPALMATRGTLAQLAVRVLAIASVTSAAIGTVAPFGGEGDDVGFRFATAEFVRLARRSPAQGAIDVVMLVAVLCVLLRRWPAERVLQADAAAGETGDIEVRGRADVLRP